MTTQTPEQWNERYREGNTPWDNDVADSELQRVIDQFQIAPCRMLEPGCGTGTNAVHLARGGFDVTAFDVSQLAIDKAQARAKAAGVAVNFLVADVFDLPDFGEPFPLVFDRGVYHCVRRQDASRFVKAIAALSAPAGYYLTLAGNPNEPEPPHGGPPRVSAEEMCRELSPAFDLVQLREFRFDPILIDGVVDQPLAWSVLWRRKADLKQER